ncbi:sugar-specific transcriptional regulator TrmB [Candidatus Bathyarchaeota archaeon]|nr:sugar-specific transcriptional regulator TrmB [Candidatus Bathyarchaeota archaeon]
MQKAEKPAQELIHYVLSVDRRLLVIKEFQHRPMLQASDVAEKVGRSLQNISHALKDLQEEKIVTCITPQKRTWKRYILTEMGKNVLNELRNRNLI